MASFRCKVLVVFRIFIDEVGNHDLKSQHPNERYLSLSGIVMQRHYESTDFTEALNMIKQDTFGTTEIVLHRRDILEAETPFDALKDNLSRSNFDEALLKLTRSARYKVSTVVIDKKEHFEKYAVWRFHPYHYCLTVLLERYVQRLAVIGQTGDVVVESRGKKENIKLEKAYRHIYDKGTDYVSSEVFQQRLTSREIKIKPKEANIAGLQLADILANPSCRDMICEKTNTAMTAVFSRKLVDILKELKYYRSQAGTITGWGRKWLP
jgi:hypothetical protein